MAFNKTQFFLLSIDTSVTLQRSGQSTLILYQRRNTDTGWKTPSPTMSVTCLVLEMPKRLPRLCASVPFILEKNKKSQKHSGLSREPFLKMWEERKTQQTQCVDI